MEIKKKRVLFLFITIMVLCCLAAVLVVTEPAITKAETITTFEEVVETEENTVSEEVKTDEDKKDWKEFFTPHKILGLAVCGTMLVALVGLGISIFGVAGKKVKR